MAENHSKYMPHHPKPKYHDGSAAPMHDPAIRQRSEPTSHDGSGNTPFQSDSYNSFHDGMGMQ